MRLFLAFSLFGVLAACSGDSSSVMSVWTDDDTGGSLGAGGQSTTSTGTGGWVGSKGGSGGQATTVPAPTGGSGGSVVTVRGGTRDVATAQCLTTSNGGGCPADAAYLQCLKTSCASALAACYQAGASGACADFAACMFACPCDSGRSDCEYGCLTTKGYGDSKCTSRLGDLMGCGSLQGCATPICLVN
jgi:hypothetical protein